MNDRNKEIKAYGGLALSTLIIGLSYIFVKIALRSANTTDLLAHRFTAAVVGMLVVYASGKVKFPTFTTKQMLPLLGLSVSYPLMFFVLQTEGLRFTSASEAGILSAMMPVLTVILAALFIKEKTNFLQIISVLISVVGIAYIIMKSGSETGENSLKGNVFILLSVLSIVTYYILGRRINKNYNSLDITFFMIITACIVFNLIAVVKHIQTDSINRFFDPLKEGSFLISVVYLGVLSSFLTSFFSNYALAIVPASQVAIFNNLSPLITIFGGILLLNEKLFAFHLSGGFLVLIGVIGTLAFRKK